MINKKSFKISNIFNTFFFKIGQKLVENIMKDKNLMYVPFYLTLLITFLKKK